MVAMDCSCGALMEANNSAELFKACRQHIDTVHPDLKMNDRQVRDIMDANVYEVQRT
jgi:predicted small metal-binding protein